VINLNTAKALGPTVPTRSSPVPTRSLTEWWLSRSTTDEDTVEIHGQRIHTFKAFWRQG
jgi:hypothetical protein